jgi:dTMP kinase
MPTTFSMALPAIATITRPAKACEIPASPWPARGRRRTSPRRRPHRGPRPPASHRPSSSASRAARAPASPPSRAAARVAGGEGYTVLLTFEPGDTAVGQGGPPDRARARRPASSPTAPRRCSTPPTRPSTSTPSCCPALARGEVVITDRYVDSRWPTRAPAALDARRGRGRRNRWATGDLRPHLTVVLDLEPRAGLGRFEERDRIEGESLEFHQRVRAGVPRPGRRRPRPLPRARRPAPVEEIAAAIRERVEPLLPGRRGDRR